MRSASPTLLGRMTIGPCLGLRRLLLSEGGELRRRDCSDLPAWASFFAGPAVILCFVCGVAGMPVWTYCLLVVLPAIPLGRLRPCPEDRCVHAAGERRVDAESNSLFGLLRPRKNRPIGHHPDPQMPSCRHAGVPRRRRERLLAPDRPVVFRGCGSIARRRLIRPVVVPACPLR
ncbi:MAG: hypothetical protein NZN45_10645 [Rhodovarius sp.]|nr:hypothetical protein [Rhodovarius sp.]